MAAYDRAKRALDIALAGPALVASLPVQAAAAVAIRATMGSPVLFRQQRPGLNGEPFEMVKFRTMHLPDPARGRTDDASRMTRVGSLLRSTSIDELPTLWNILKGDMSIVGPRPLLMQYLPLYSPEQARRHDVRPGLTGLAQSRGRNSLSWEEKFALDVEYVDRRSLLLDLRIIADTALAVVKREGIAAEGQATAAPFTGSALPAAGDAPAAAPSPGTPAATSGADSSPGADTSRAVLQIFGIMDRGGAEMRAVELGRALAPQGYVFHYITLSGRRGVLADDIEAAGGKVIPMKLGPQFAPRFVALLRRERYRVVQSHVATFSGLILALAHTAGVPGRIAHFRSDGDNHGQSLPRQMQRRVMKRLIHDHATDILGVSPGTLTHGYREDWRKDPRTGLLVDGIHPSTLPPAAQPVPGATWTLINVGRPLPTKRRDLAGEITARLIERGVDARLRLVGLEGEDTEAAARVLRAAGGDDAVDVTGLRSDVRQLVHEAEITLFPSALEGLPGVVLESLAEGTPVVASRIPGNEFITDNLPGIHLVDVDAPVDAWADAVEAVMADYPDRAALRSAFERCPFTFQAMEEQSRRVYDRYLPDGRPAQ